MNYDDDVLGVSNSLHPANQPDAKKESGFNASDLWEWSRNHRANYETTVVFDKAISIGYDHGEGEFFVYVDGFDTWTGLDEQEAIDEYNKALGL